MNTVDDNICAKILRGFDITPDVFVKKFQMGAVGLIDNEDFARIVNHLGDGFDVTAESLRCSQDAPSGSNVFRQR